MNILQTLKTQFAGLFPENMMSAPAPTGSLGVDIGSCAVKIVRLEANKDGARVLGFACEKIVDKNVRDALSKALVKARASLDQSAVVSISGQGVVSRYVELPLMSRSELDSSMKFEIEKYVPFPLTEVSSDFLVIQEMRDKAKMFVLIAAAKNDLIQKKCTIAKEVGLNLKAIDLDCLALANFATEIAGFKEKGSCFGIINIGKSISNIDILVDGVPCLSRDIFIGGDDLTKKISESREVDYLQAEKFKLEPGNMADELMRILDGVLNDLASEIRVSLDYFEARNNRAVDNIYITGGTSRLNGIEVYLNHLLAVDVKKLDYCSRLKFGDGVNAQEFKTDCDLFAIALGLALR